MKRLLQVLVGLTALLSFGFGLLSVLPGAHQQWVA